MILRTNTPLDAIAAPAFSFLSAQRLRLRSAGGRLAVVAMTLISAAQPAAAQTAGGTGSLTSFLQNVGNLLTGTTGQALAIIAVALSGIGAMFGALSARAFGGVVLGCAIVFSAAWIVGQITGNGTGL